MEPNTQNSSGMMNGIPPVAKPERKIGPIIGALIIVLIIIIASLWFFGQKLNTDSDQPEQQGAVRNEAGLSTSTNEVDLEADLDAQLNDVDYSF